MTRTLIVGGLSLMMSTTLASALSPELARTRRDSALKAYPYELPGTGLGNAQNEIRSYEECLARGETDDATGGAKTTPGAGW